MKFYSIVSNINYEVTPDHYEYHGPDIRNREKVKGVTAHFVDHLFDTEGQGYDDATKEQVEAYLMAHENFNTQWLQLLTEEPERKFVEFAETGICISRIVTDEGVVDCDQQAVQGEFYCSRHLAVPEAVSR